MTSVAVIGAGLASLSLAKKLEGQVDITIFEKSQGVGGRMSTRNSPPYQFDHGAQYFTARSKTFQEFLDPLIDSGLVVEWNPKIVTLEFGKTPNKLDWFEPHYIAVPKMNSLCKYMAEGKKINLNTKIKKLFKTLKGWELTDANHNIHSYYDWVVSTLPAKQLISFFPQTFNDFTTIESTKMVGCFSLMIGLKKLPKLDWQAAIIKNSAIGWISVNSAKPGRNNKPSLLVQTTNEWAESQMGEDINYIQATLLKELTKFIELDINEFSFIKTHIWHYANTALSAGKDYLIDPKQKLAACGDWCISGKVESAFLSAHSLANKIMSLKK
jgi:predicted NAD/FAD-dependent oxidoreductase